MTCKFVPGDRVIKNDATWIPNDFDSWGRGIGVGVVVQAPFTLDDLSQVDVRWLLVAASNMWMDCCRLPKEAPNSGALKHAVKMTSRDAYRALATSPYAIYAARRLFDR